MSKLFSDSFLPISNNNPTLSFVVAYSRTDDNSRRTSSVSLYEQPLKCDLFQIKNIQMTKQWSDFVCGWMWLYCTYASFKWCMVSGHVTVQHCNYVYTVDRASFRWPQRDLSCCDCEWLVHHSIVMNVTWQRLDQSAEQLVVGYTTE